MLNKENVLNLSPAEIDDNYQVLKEYGAQGTLTNLVPARHRCRKPSCPHRGSGNNQVVLPVRKVHAVHEGCCEPTAGVNKNIASLTAGKRIHSLIAGFAITWEQFWKPEIPVPKHDGMFSGGFLMFLFLRSLHDDLDPFASADRGRQYSEL